MCNMSESTPENQEITFWAGIFIVFLCALFGVNAVAIKISLTGIGSLTAAGLRFFFAAVTIAIWAFITGRAFKIKQGQFKHLVLLSIIFTVQLSLFYIGLSKTYASRSVLIANLLPFMVLFLSHYFIPGDRITVKKFIGIMMGFTGVVFMFFERKGVTTDLQTGDIIVFMAVLIWSGNAVYTKKIINNFVPFQLVFYPMIFAAPFFFIGGVFMDEKMIFDLNYKVMCGLLYQIFVTASFGFVAWSTLLKKYGASALHSFVFIMPIAGVSLGGILLGEPITSKILVALILITSGILLVHFKVRKFTPSFPLGRGL